MMSAWVHEPDVVGVFLIQIYRGLSRHERDVADSDIAELHKATEEFTAAHPENQVFRTFKLDENDVVGSLTGHAEGPSNRRPGDQGHSRTSRARRAAAGVRRRTGEPDLRRSLHQDRRRPRVQPPAVDGGAGQAAATAAFDSRVVIDASAASTLTLLDPAIVDKLVGAFLALETTDSAYRDALGAQQSLNMRSTMTLGWDAKQSRPLITETSQDEAEAFARRADRVVELLARSERRGWPGLKRFAEFAGDGTWLSALDLAMSEQTRLLVRRPVTSSAGRLRRRPDLRHRRPSRSAGSCRPVSRRISGWPSAPGWSLATT